MGTDDAMHDSVLAEEDDFAGGTDEPLAVFPSLPVVVWQLTKGKLFDCFIDSDWHAHEVIGSDGDSPSLKEGMFEVVQQVVGVLYTDTKTDKVLRKTTSSANSWVDRGMSV